MAEAAAKEEANATKAAAKAEAKEAAAEMMVPTCRPSPWVVPGWRRAWSTMCPTASRPTLGHGENKG